MRLTCWKNQSDKPPPNIGSTANAILDEERTQGGRSITRQLRGAGTRRSSHRYPKEDMAGPCNSADTGRTPRSHLHHSGIASTGTSIVPTPQEKYVPGGDMGDSTAHSLQDMQHRLDQQDRYYDHFDVELRWQRIDAQKREIEDQPPAPKIRTYKEFPPLCSDKNEETHIY